MTELNGDTIDLSDTIFEGKDPRVLDTNGQKYLAGWDKYGLYSILGVEFFPSDTEEDLTFQRIDEFAHTAFSPGDAEGVIEDIQKGL